MLRKTGTVVKCLYDDGCGGTPEGPPLILKRQQINARHWLYLNRNFESHFKTLVGSAHEVRRACQQLGKRWTHGIHDCERYLSPPASP